VLCFWIGVYPKPFLAFLHRPMAALAEVVQPGRFEVREARAPAPVTAGGAAAATPAAGTR
jgi:hypothetical protein